MGNQASARNWHFTAETIKDAYLKAFTAIEQGITCEENEKPREALKYYKLGIYHIDQALKIPVEYPEDVKVESFKEVVAMVQKMKSTRGEVLQRIMQIIKSPSYEEAQKSSQPESPTSDDGGNTGITYSDLARALENMKASMLNEDTSLSPSSSSSEVAEVFRCRGVRVFHIRPDGSVTAHQRNDSTSSSDDDDELIIVKITDKIDRTYSMKIGEWVYPLIPGVSPCFRANFKAFIFPDLFSDIPGSAVGLVVPDEHDAALLSLLEDILHGVVYQSGGTAVEDGRKSSTGTPQHSLTREAVEEEIRPNSTAETIVYGLTTGAQYLSWGLIKGAEKTGDLMNYVTPKIISKMNAGASGGGDGEQAAANSKVNAGLNVAKNVTGAAVEVTGYVAEKVTIATVALGRFLAPHIQKQGERVFRSGLNLSEEEAKSKMGGILTVAAGAVEGFATVYSGLEESASILGENFKNNTVKVVEYKYGPGAGTAVADTLSTVGNALAVTENVKGLKPQKLAKKTAKAAGKAVIATATTSAGNTLDNDGLLDEVSNSAVYPDLSELSRELLKSERQ